jgi:hypothetical protein
MFPPEKMFKGEVKGDWVLRMSLMTIFYSCLVWCCALLFTLSANVFKWPLLERSLEMIRIHDIGTVFAIMGITFLLGRRWDRPFPSVSAMFAYVFIMLLGVISMPVYFLKDSPEWSRWTPQIGFSALFGMTLHLFGQWRISPFHEDFASITLRIYEEDGGKDLIRVAYFVASGFIAYGCLNAHLLEPVYKGFLILAVTAVMLNLDRWDSILLWFAAMQLLIMVPVPGITIPVALASIIIALLNE